MDDIEQLKARIAELEAQIAAVAPAVDARYTMDQMRDYALAFHKSRIDAAGDKAMAQGVFSPFNACMYRDECRARASAQVAVDAQPVAEVVKWQTFTGHTAWDLKVFDKTLEHGAKLYASAQSEGLRKDAERYRWLRNDGFVPADFEKQIDAALSKHTGEKS